MSKDTLADKIAKKTFESPQFQQSWQIHFQAFAPILENAFKENYQAKVHLTAALNHISKRELNKGLEKLQEINKHLETDADKAAYLFFIGLCYEMAGNLPQMAVLYEEAGRYNHKFYLPYLKTAKFYLQYGDYEPAYENYSMAIKCFENRALSPQETMIVASAYVNMTTCLTMMHRYEEAIRSMANYHTLNVSIPNSLSAEALLMAVTGQNDKAELCLEQIKNTTPELYDRISISVQSVFDRTNPAFFPVETEADRIKQFWVWFGEYNNILYNLINAQQYEEAVSPVAEKLLETFPFLEEPPIISIGENEKGYVLELRDMYFVAVADAFDKLIDACPDIISRMWQFAIVH